ncbi:hypothetical protein [Dongia sp. agr-C8]
MAVVGMLVQEDWKILQAGEDRHRTGAAAGFDGQDRARLAFGESLGDAGPGFAGGV